MSRNLMTTHKALDLRGYVDYMSQEKKEEEDSPALKIVWKHQYDDSKTILKRALTTNEKIEQQLGNRNGNKK